jgi:hypothetical protein
MTWRITCPQGHQHDFEDRDEVTVPGLVCPTCDPPYDDPPPPRPLPGGRRLRGLFDAGYPATPVRRDSSGGGGAGMPEVPGYEILGQLGQGGMGVVYRARQQSLKRLVALKLIQAGLDGGEHLARFRAEAEAAARLQHPNVVPIYEVGTYQGRPYLALEYAAGGSLADALNGTPLPAAEAARLTATLARAIHYAHERGIVHRDLKPANVMLSFSGRPPGGASFAPPGGRPLNEVFPKIADFGLAKHLDRDGSGDGPTRTGAVLGTPSYMAPEQAMGRGKEVGPAADVYSLGAILYELLTGRPPFKAASSLETLEQVRAQDPVPPRRLRAGLPADVQTVCLKCLEKDPRRRYATAAELADDLDRFLDNRPSLARPAGPGERLGKWARRQPALAALVGVSALAVLVLLGVMAWFNARLRAQVVRAEAGEQAALKQRQRAEFNYRKARDMSNAMLARVRDRQLAGIPRLGELRRGLQEDALAFYQGVLLDLDDPDPAVRADAAAAYYQAGEIQANFGQTAAAAENLRRAREIYERLVQEDSERAEHRRALANTYNALGYVAEDRPQEAERCFINALAQRERLAGDHPDDPQALGELAQGHFSLARFYQFAGRRLKDAETHYRRSIALRQEVLQRTPTDAALQQALAETDMMLGLLLSTTADRHREAEETYGEARTLLEGLVRGPTATLGAKCSLVATYTNLGNLLHATGRTAAGLALMEDGSRLIQDVLRQEPGLTSAREQAVNLFGSRAGIYGQTKRYAESVPDWDRVVELADEPDRRGYRITRAAVRALTGDHASAAAEAKELAAAPLSGADWYNLACACSHCAAAAERDPALSAAERARLKGEYAGLALDYLRRCRAAGGLGEPDLAHQLTTDTDLDAVRPLPGLQKLLKEVQAR